MTDHIEGVVTHVSDDRKPDSLNEYFDTLFDEEKGGIECVTMDMSKACIKSVKQYVPEADQCIAFDKFHIAQSPGQAVNKVRIDENVALIKQGSNLLKRTRYDWLTNPENLTDEQWDNFEPLHNSKLKTARAWAISLICPGTKGDIQPRQLVKFTVKIRLGIAVSITSEAINQ